VKTCCLASEHFVADKEQSFKASALASEMQCICPAHLWHFSQSWRTKAGILDRGEATVWTVCH